MAWKNAENECLGMGEENEKFFCCVFFQHERMSQEHAMKKHMLAV